MRNIRLAILAFAAIALVYQMRADGLIRPLYALKPAVGPSMKEGTSAHRGSVRGQVTWAGEIPKPAAFIVEEGPYVPRGAGARPNPYAPQVDLPTKGLAGVVVEVEGVPAQHNSDRAFPPINVVADGLQLWVDQGAGRGRVGIARVGDTVRLTAMEDAMHSIRARGAAFFTQMLPDPQQGSLSRRMESTGWVDLSSASHYPWSAGRIRVLDHPYAAVSGTDGRFEITGLPAGEYRLKFSLMSWHVDSVDRDPENLMIVRRRYVEPLERLRTFKLNEQSPATTVNLTVSATDFANR